MGRADRGRQGHVPIGHVLARSPGTDVEMGCGTILGVTYEVALHDSSRSVRPARTVYPVSIIHGRRGARTPG
ncbi:hypothetical protein P8C59_004637 [Phyllachora maydis]|uniref:Uncharacterized protein n=1 Tax=Phyllachora maydis TaxID=1825666 RepID=A0AAD9MAM5_9PEZI|nr:hypothetical protein P8C59_004637 [Phyllachora maydis]